MDLQYTKFWIQFDFQHHLVEHTGQRCHTSAHYARIGTPLRIWGEGFYPDNVFAVSDATHLYATHQSNGSQCLKSWFVFFQCEGNSPMAKQYFEYVGFWFWLYHDSMSSINVNLGSRCTFTVMPIMHWELLAASQQCNFVGRQVTLPCNAQFWRSLFHLLGQLIGTDIEVVLHIKYGVISILISHSVCNAL